MFHIHEAWFVSAWIALRDYVIYKIYYIQNWHDESIAIFRLTTFNAASDENVIISITVRSQFQDS